MINVQQTTKPNTMFNTYSQKQKSATKNTPKGGRASGQSKKGVSRIAMKENVQVNTRSVSKGKKQEEGKKIRFLNNFIIP